MDKINLDQAILDALWGRMPMGLALFDREFRVLRFNETWEAYVIESTPNVSGAIQPGTSYFDLDPGTEATLMPQFERVLNGEVVRLDAIPLDSQGLLSYWDVVLTPIYQDGKVVAFLDVITNATERIATNRKLEQTLAALKKRDQDFTSLLENAQDFVVYRVAIDPEDPYGGHVDMVSPSIRHILGITDPYRFASWFEEIHPDDLPRVLEANRRSWRECVPYNEIVRIFHPDREEWIWIHTMSRPVMSEQGKPSHFNGLILDITEQKEAELALQRQITLNSLITTISTNFINMPLEDIDAGINDALSKVGVHTNVDRSYVFLFGDAYQAMTCAYEWCNEDIEAQIDNLHDIDVSDFAWSNNTLLEGNILHIPDVLKLPDIAETERREFSRQGIRSLVAVPMAYRGRILGFLGFDAVKHQKAWDDETINILRILGSIFANALEHKDSQQALQEAQRTLELRVEQRTREIERRRQAAEGLHDILKLLNSDKTLDEILQVIISQACQLVDADAGVIYGYDADKTHSATVALVGMPEGFETLGPFELTGTAPQRATAQQKIHYVQDFDTYFADAPIPENPSLREWVRAIRGNFKAKLTAPVFILQQPYGALEFYYDVPRSFSEELSELAIMIGNQAALAIENARLRDQAEQAAVAKERNRIARELHDSVSQALYGIALGTRTARTLLDRQSIDETARSSLANPLDYVLSLADAGLAEMRALIFELRPDALEKEGLVATLQKQAEAVRVRHKIDVMTDLCEELPDLPLTKKEAFYRVAQEALNNIIKHAHATEICIRLLCCERKLILEVSDNGTGFDPQQEYPGHLGLQTMRERIIRLGGTFTIESQPAQGTTIVAQLAF